MYAIRLRDEGFSAEEIAARLDEKKNYICLFALFDTLEYLKRGGRLSSTAAWAGNLLSIKPVISVEKGEVVILGKARGSKNGNNLLIQQVSAHNGIDFSMPYCVGYTGMEDSMLQKYLKDSVSIWENEVPVENIRISSVGSTIGTHAGPGAIAVSFFHR